MNREHSPVKSIFAVLFLSSALLACSMTDKMLPNAEFNTLMVEADAVAHDGRWNDALSKLDQAAILQPNNLSVKLKQGQAYQQSGKLALAHNAYQQIIDANPNPSGKNVEIVAAAKASQAKLGFGSAVLAQESVPVKASELKSAEPVEEVAAVNIAEKAKTAASDATPVKEPAQEEKPVAPVSEAETINVQIEAWREAWQEKHVSDYLSFYVQDFSGDFSSHAEWRKQRTHKLSAASDLSIQISALKVELQGDARAVATFVQSFQSANYADNGLKTLQLQKINERWLIEREQFSKQ